MRVRNLWSFRIDRRKKVVIYSIVAIQIFFNTYLSTQQFFRLHPANTDKLYSSFVIPFQCYFGLYLAGNEVRVHWSLFCFDGRWAKYSFCNLYVLAVKHNFREHKFRTSGAEFFYLFRSVFLDITFRFRSNRLRCRKRSETVEKTHKKRITM